MARISLGTALRKKRSLLMTLSSTLSKAAACSSASSRFKVRPSSRYGVDVARELHHHRFLERTAIRVTIATLWQTGYTVNENVRVRAGKPDERCKKGAISNGPERARISWGRAMRGRGSGGGTYLIALGVAT
jgi:hypothetical protein